MMKNKRGLLLGIVIFIVITAIFLINYYPKKENFSVDTILLKLSLPLNGESVNSIKITNNEKRDEKFNLYFINLKNIASVNEKDFTLKSGESKGVKIYFKDNINKSKIYFGELVIETASTKKSIPIILNIEDKKQIFAIIQKGIPEYNNIYPGGKLGVEIKIFNLNDNALHNTNIRYSIKNSEGGVIFSEDGELVIKGNLGVTKIINIPKTLGYGDYIFTSSIDYNGSKSAAGYFFRVSKKNEGTFSGNFGLLIAIIFVFITGIIILFFYFMKTRDELLVQLKQQQNIELKRNLELIENFEKRIQENEKTPQKKKKIKRLKKAKKEIIKDIKIKQERQRDELKKLKREGRNNELKEKINTWEKEGYKMFETEKKINKISKQSIKKDMGNWKKEGYDTRFLNK